jgi:hypothetical protein
MKLTLAWRMTPALWSVQIGTRVVMCIVSCGVSLVFAVFAGSGFEQCVSWKELPRASRWVSVPPLREACRSERPLCPGS